MSDTLLAGGAAAPVPILETSWALRRRQLLAVMRLEAKKSFLGRRAFGLYLLALAPPAILLLKWILGHQHSEVDLAEPTTIFAAVIFQAFLLRVVIFLACVSIFGNLIRRELLDRSLHYYFLSPLRRELLVVAKYLTGLAAAVLLFCASTAASFLLTFAPYQGFSRFLTQGPGLSHLGSYLLVTALACAGYGAVFLAFGCFFRSPAIPALIVFGWEGIHFLLPPLLKKLSVIHYVQSLCPVPVSQGPLALLSDAPSPWAAIPGLLLFSALLVALSAWRVRRMEIKYEDD